MGSNRKLSRDNRVQIIAAVIGAIATVTGAVIGAIFVSSPSSAPWESSPSPAPDVTSSSAASGPGTPFPVRYRLPPGTLPETEEEPSGAPTFADYNNLAQKDRISPGFTVGVYCRVPGSATTIATVGKAGWYKIMDLDHKVAYVGANTFYNDPGNGYGTSPDPAPFDPKVPVCGQG